MSEDSAGLAPSSSQDNQKADEATRMEVGASPAAVPMSDELKRELEDWQSHSEVALEAFPYEEQE